MKFRYNSARKCIAGMLCASLIILLVNNPFSQFLGAYLSYFNFMYYLYAFSGYNGAELTGKITLSGVLVNLITGTQLIYGIRRRTDRMILQVSTLSQFSALSLSSASSSHSTSCRSTFPFFAISFSIRMAFSREIGCL